VEVQTCALIWIIAGRRKASVFPDPVAEMPTISRPINAIGHPGAWIGVGWLNFCFMTSVKRYSGMEASSKV